MISSTYLAFIHHHFCTAANSYPVVFFLHSSHRVVLFWPLAPFIFQTSLHSKIHPSESFQRAGENLKIRGTIQNIFFFPGHLTYIILPNLTLKTSLWVVDNYFYYLNSPRSHTEKAGEPELYSFLPHSTTCAESLRTLPSIAECSPRFCRSS